MIPDELKNKLRSVLISRPKGVQLHRFLGDYRALVKEQLAYKQLGFKSLIELLRSVPDCVRLVGRKMLEQNLCKNSVFRIF